MMVREVVMRVNDADNDVMNMVVDAKLRNISRQLILLTPRP